MTYQSMSHLKEAVAYETYADYCQPRREIGLGCMPESLFVALKEQERCLVAEGSEYVE